MTLAALSKQVVGGVSRECVSGDRKMTKRLEMLKASLVKKEAELDRRMQAHFDTVKQANGQPLNDKRNGQATLNKWEKQNDAIRNQQVEIEKNQTRY